MLVREAGAIVIALMALHVGRAVAVYGCFAVLRKVRGERVPIKWQHVMVGGNIKGALSMAAVLALPKDLPFRDRLVTIVFGVTFVTLVTQALPFRRFLEAMGVTLGYADALVARAKVRLVAARRGLAELDQLLQGGVISRHEHADRRAAYQRHVIEAETVIRSREAGQVRDPDVDISLLTAEKAAVLDAARRGLLETDQADKFIADIDRELVRLSEHG
jgi:CPA1 family monovalent cation:H+ antiporter